MSSKKPSQRKTRGGVKRTFFGDDGTEEKDNAITIGTAAAQQRLEAELHAAEAAAEQQLRAAAVERDEASRRAEAAQSEARVVQMRMATEREAADAAAQLRESQLREELAALQAETDRLCALVPGSSPAALTAAEEAAATHEGRFFLVSAADLAFTMVALREVRAAPKR